MDSIKNFMQGKKTYLAVVIGILYLAGCWLGFWEFSEAFLAAVGLSGLGFLRAAMKKGNGTNGTDGANGTNIGALMVLFAGLLATTLVVTGCKATLEPGGAYAPVTTNSVGTVVTNADMQLYAVDSAFALSVKTLEFVCTYEEQNRATLYQLSPEILRTLNKVRNESWEVAILYYKARDAYIAAPSAAGLASLQLYLTKFQAVSAAAQAVLPDVAAKFSK